VDSWREGHETLDHIVMADRAIKVDDDVFTDLEVGRQVVARADDAPVADNAPPPDPSARMDQGRESVS
jgi:hypothetical protein